MSVTVVMDRSSLLPWGKYQFGLKLLKNFFRRTNCFLPPLTPTTRQLRLFSRLSDQVRMEVTVEAEKVLKLYFKILESRAMDGWNYDNHLFYFRNNGELQDEYLKPAILTFARACSDHIDNWNEPRSAYKAYISEHAELIDRVLRRLVAKYHLHAGAEIAKPLKMHFRNVTLITLEEETAQQTREVRIARWWQRVAAASDDDLECISPFPTDGSNLPNDC